MQLQNQLECVGGQVQTMPVKLNHLKQSKNQILFYFS